MTNTIRRNVYSSENSNRLHFYYANDVLDLSKRDETVIYEGEYENPPAMLFKVKSQEGETVLTIFLTFEEANVWIEGSDIAVRQTVGRLESALRLRLSLLTGEELR